jgi:hypothetical protein
MSCLVDHSEAAFSLPDDLEREMTKLGDKAHQIDDNIATILTSAAFEHPMPQVMLMDSWLILVDICFVYFC